MIFTGLYITELLEAGALEEPAFLHGGTRRADLLPNTGYSLHPVLGSKSALLIDDEEVLGDPFGSWGGEGMELHM